MVSSFLKMGVISASFMPSSKVEFVIPKFTIFSNNSLQISILSLNIEVEMLPDGHATFDLRFKISVWISLRSEYWKLNVPFHMVSFILRMLGCFENVLIIFSIGSLILLKSVRRWSICGILNEVTAFSKNVSKVSAT